MRIERVTGHAFGPFTGESLDLAPGLTVVSGPNEAGKSKAATPRFEPGCAACAAGGEPGRKSSPRSTSAIAPGR